MTELLLFVTIGLVVLLIVVEVVGLSRIVRRCDADTKKKWKAAILSLRAANRGLRAASRAGDGEAVVESQLAVTQGREDARKACDDVRETVNVQADELRERRRKPLADATSALVKFVLRTLMTATLIKTFVSKPELQKVKLHVLGFASGDGNRRYNENLARQRAAAVATIVRKLDSSRKLREHSWGENHLTSGVANSRSVRIVGCRSEAGTAEDSSSDSSDQQQQQARAATTSHNMGRSRVSRRTQTKRSGRPGKGRDEK